MTFGSVCSGIEAASVAWHPLGWRTAWVAEIDPFCSALLKHHYPEVHNYGDFTAIPDSAEPVDVLVGGTPCQDFSVAGLRAGLGGERGRLTIEFAYLAERLRPRWLVWENVPGVLSIDGGRAFGAFLGILGKLGYGFAYRVLDAQYAGVPQRRRRVFVVGHLGDWRRAAAVLFERHSLSGYPPPRRKVRQDVAPTISARTKGGGGLWTDFDLDGGLICPTLESGTNSTGGTRPPGTTVDTADSLIVASTGHTSHCLNAGGMGRIDYETETLVAFDPRQIHHPANFSNPKAGDPCHPLRGVANCEPAIAFNLRGRDEGSQPELSDVASVRAASGGSSRSYVAFDTTQLTSKANRSNPQAGDPCHPLASGAHAPAIAGSAVRRLLPVECEALQGFPRNYTNVPYRGKPAADGPRYKSLGNSMAVPVMRWIGERIQMVDDIELKKDLVA